MRARRSRGRVQSGWAEPSLEWRSELLAQVEEPDSIPAAGASPTDGAALREDPSGSRTTRPSRARGGRARQPRSRQPSGNAVGGLALDAGPTSKIPLFVVWHRWSELRVHDHEPLMLAQAAAERENGRILHLYPLEVENLLGCSQVAGIKRCSLRRALFWQESVISLARSIEKESGGKNELVISYDLQALEAAATAASLKETPGHAYSRHYASTVGVFSSLLSHLSTGRASEELELQAVFTHASCCTEEVETERQVRCVLTGAPESIGEACQGTARPELVIAWGGLTMHHVQDLPWKPSDIAFPLYKGEFQKALKANRVRPRSPVETPCRWAPGPDRLLHGFSEASPRLAAFVRTTKDTKRAASGCAVTDVFRVLLGLEADLHDSVAAFDPVALLPDNAKAQPARPHEPLPLLGRSPFMYPPPTPSLCASATDQIGGSAPDARAVVGSWFGGEQCALAYLEYLLFETDAVAHYKGATESFNVSDVNNSINAGTRLSPWLAFGCLSPRTLMHKIRTYERTGFSKAAGRVKGSVAPSVRLFQELVFRDFLRFSALRWGRRLFLLGGPFQIHDTYAALPSFWRPNSFETDALFRRWQLGQTGFPFVDAGMRELALSGYMSHLHRQVAE